MDKLWKSLSGVLVTVLISGAATAEAAVPPSSSASSLKVPAGDHQLELLVAAKPDELRLSLCARGRCDEEHATTLAFPNGVRGNGSKATLEIVEVAKGRRVAHVRVPAADNLAWEAIVAAPLGAGEPRVIFSGLTGLLRGEPGERSGPLLMVRGRSVLLGQQREDVQICGRETILAPELLSSRDFSLHAAKVQRLSPEERKRATVLRAERSSSVLGWSPLRALLASSAVGSPQALTDGNPNTYWGENRGGDGRGEFVVLRAPKELPLSAFQLSIRAASDSKDLAVSGQQVSPKQFWLVTDDQVFAVTLPEDGWKKPGTSYRVQLPKPIKSECVAVVLENSFSTRKDAQVVIAELGAESELNGRNADEVVRSLNGGGESAKAAAAALRYGGTLAFDAIKAGFAALDERGRDLALDVIDGAPCSQAAPVYVAALTGPYPGQRVHVESRLGRCSNELGESIVSELRSPKTAVEIKVALAKQLPSIAPQLSAGTVPELLTTDSAVLRAAYREVLQRIAGAPGAQSPLRAALRNPALSRGARLDLVRALSPFSQSYSPELGQAFAELVRAERGFEGRYLLLGPAAKLATSDVGAQAFLKSAFGESEFAELRAEAARKADPKAFEAQLIAAMRDPAVRVREAAIEALSPAEAVQVPLLERLENDAWPRVRAAAARQLARLPANDEIDEALAGALDDESRHVRRPVVDALGERHARRYAAEVRDVLVNKDEDPYVRAAAATALGAMCDAGALDLLTRHARALAIPRSADYELIIARSATLALANLGPRDLKTRLAPLSKSDASPIAQRIAREAMAAPSHCSASGVTHAGAVN